MNPINPAHIPQELTALPQWVCWRLELIKKRESKVPYDPHTGRRASSTNPAMWASFEEALQAARNPKCNYNGIGIMFNCDRSNLVGIDIDKCISNGVLNEVATEILGKVKSTYVEVSPSGTGLHIFLKGTMPPEGNRNSKSGVEMYFKERYFTVTGVPYKNCVNQIAEDNSAIEWIHKTYIKPRSPKKKETYKIGSTGLGDDRILQLARNGEFAAEFNQLWSGNWQGKFPSQSEADFALCKHLAYWSGKNEEQIDRLFRQSGLMRTKWDESRSNDGRTYGTKTIDAACSKQKKVYIPPKPKNITERHDGYWRQKGEKPFQINNFKIVPKVLVQGEKETQLTCDFVCEDGTTFTQTFLTDDMSSLAKFKKVLAEQTFRLCFYGTDCDVEYLKDYLGYLDWKIKIGVKDTGIHMHNGRLLYVDPETAVDANGTVDETIVQLEKYIDIESNILKKSPMTDSSDLYFIGQNILGYNEYIKTVPILAWISACFIKTHLWFNDVKFPQLSLVGEGGGGKSTTFERIVIPTFSYSRTANEASQLSKFTMMLESASSNLVPQVIEEFKPSKIGETLTNHYHNHFRSAYDGHRGKRGKPDLRRREYKLVAPILVAGEENPNETAIKERSIELLFAKKHLDDDVNRKQIIKTIKRNPKKLSAFGRSLLNLALATNYDEVKSWYEDGEDMFEDKFAYRIVTNLACLYAGLKFVEKLCLSFGYSWSYFFPITLNECCEHLETSVKKYLLGGRTHNKTIVDKTFEIMARMPLKYGEDYVFKNAGKRLCIRMRRVYDKHCKYRKDHAIAGEVLEIEQFYTQLMNVDYFIDKNKATRFGNNNNSPPKAWIIDFEKLSQRADVDGFMENHETEAKSSENDED